MGMEKEMKNKYIVIGDIYHRDHNYTIQYSSLENLGIFNIFEEAEKCFIDNMDSHDVIKIFEIECEEEKNKDTNA
jgi:hypothetical protein